MQPPGTFHRAESTVCASSLPSVTRNYAGLSIGSIPRALPLHDSVVASYYTRSVALDFHQSTMHIRRAGSLRKLPFVTGSNFVFLCSV